ncbi:hypothetical protein HZS_3968, partial [Henneguya salminicola]
MLADQYRRLENEKNMKILSEPTNGEVPSKISVSNPKTPRNNYYRGYLMESNISARFPFGYDEWVVVIRPVGTRCLVVSRNVKPNQVYDELGDLIKKFTSILPGGGLGINGLIRIIIEGACMIDCIFWEAANRFFILDVLGWNGQIFVHCPPSERFSFINLKILDLSIGKAVNNFCILKNIPMFYDLPRFKACINDIVKYSQVTCPFRIDSYLWYHSKSYYDL